MKIYGIEIDSSLGANRSKAQSILDKALDKVTNGSTVKEKAERAKRMGYRALIIKKGKFGTYGEMIK